MIRLPKVAVTAVPSRGTPSRGRRPWAVVMVAAVMVMGAAAGLVACAPPAPLPALTTSTPATTPATTSAPQPVLRPAGLVAGRSTAHSITLEWSRPPTGPLPDDYLIMSNGTQAGSVAGTVTSYRQAGLAPATTYRYAVVAVRGSTRSPRSAVVTVRTKTPPISQARLQGAWNVYAKNIGHVRGWRNGSLYWRVRPVCADGACEVILRQKDGKLSVGLTLTRAGAVYKGRATITSYRCGPAGRSIADPMTLTFRVHVTAAAARHEVWAATALRGTLVSTSPYVSSANFYCPANTVRAALTGTPA